MRIQKEQRILYSCGHVIYVHVSMLIGSEMV